MNNDRECMVAVMRCRRTADGNQDALRVAQLLEDRIKGDTPDQLADLRRKAAPRQKNYRKRQQDKCNVTENPENDDCSPNTYGDVTV